MVDIGEVEGKPPSKKGYRSLDFAVHQKEAHESTIQHIVTQKFCCVSNIASFFSIIGHTTPGTQLQVILFIDEKSLFSVIKLLLVKAKHKLT